jgi:hypothetical protein
VGREIYKIKDIQGEGVGSLLTFSLSSPFFALDDAPDSSFDRLERIEELFLESLSWEGLVWVGGYGAE